MTFWFAFALSTSMVERLAFVCFGSSLSSVEDLFLLEGGTILNFICRLVR